MTDKEKKSPTIGTVLQGTYKLERLLGEGGMGAVYEASHSRLGRRFAVKMLSPDVATFPEALARFQREAQITSELGHPHILEVIDFNETDDRLPYIVMELLEGEDLAELLQRSPKMSLELTLRIIQPAIAGLKAAHERGVIHRDLKPSNLFLCKHGEDPQFVKVVDFGISKVLGAKSALTQTHVTIGTPSYMAPEQAEGRAAEVDQRTDVYALGTIIYEMLGGRPPFAAETIPAMLYQVVHQAPLSLRELRPDLPEPIYAIVERALAKKPEDRFATMKALNDALAKAVGQPATKTDDDKTLPVVSGPTERAPAVAMGTTLSASAGEIQQPQPVKPEEATGVVPRSRAPMIVGGVAVALVAGVVGLLAIPGDPQQPRQPQPMAQPSTPPAKPDLAKLSVADAAVADVVRPDTTAPVPRKSDTPRKPAPRRKTNAWGDGDDPKRPAPKTQPKPKPKKPKPKKPKPGTDDGWGDGDNWR